MISRILVPVLAGTLLVAGCQFPHGFPALGTGDVANGSAVLRLQPEIASGGFRAQGEVVPYTSIHVQRLELSLFKLDVQGHETVVRNSQGNALVVTVSKGDLYGRVAFEKLNAKSTYRVKARAYDNTDSLISEDTRSQTDIPILQEDRPTLANLKVQLKDKPFDGQGSTTVDVVSGALVPAGSESITVN